MVELDLGQVLHLDLAGVVDDELVVLERVAALVLNLGVSEISRLVSHNNSSYSLMN